MFPYPSVQTAALTSLLMLLQPQAGHAQTCQPASIPATTPANQFTDHSDGTVTDKKTGLMWKRCSEGQSWDGITCTGTAAVYTWQAALQQAQAVNGAGGFAGYTDWRVPNIKELASLIEEQCQYPAINITIFPAIPFDFYWSASPYANDGSSAWTLSFGDSSDNWINKNNLLYVRLTR
jgi:hypothetical protein